MKKSGIVPCIFLLGLTTFGCVSKEELPVSKYYDYDSELPLEDTVGLADSTAKYLLYNVKFKSVHSKAVSGLLTIPKGVDGPLPVIILLHGVGDRKTVDYIESGHQYFWKSGYAVFRIDLLMINAENDEVIAPITSKMLYQEADEPKEIIWYPSRHRDLPIDKAYPAGIKWFQQHL